MALCHARLLQAFFALLILPNLARALRNITIENRNSRIQYFPPEILSGAECQSRPENDACSGHWWTESTIHETFGPHTGLSFDFQGSALYFFGVTLDAGARALASIDDNPPTIIEFSSPYPSPHYEELIYAAADLDPGQQHTFHLRFSGPRSTSQDRKWMGVNYLVYTTRDDSTDVDDLSTSSAASATDAGSVHPTNFPGAGGSGDLTRSDDQEPTSRPSTDAASQPLNPATLAGIAVGVTCGVVFLLLVPLVVWLVRRQLGAQRVQSIALLKHPAPSADPSPASTPARRPSPFAAQGPYDPPDQRRYSAAFGSSASSPGAAVDERLPFALAPVPPRQHRIRRGPLKFLVHNPDTSSRGTVSHVGSASDHAHR